MSTSYPTPWTVTVTWVGSTSTSLRSRNVIIDSCRRAHHLDAPLFLVSSGAEPGAVPVSVSSVVDWPSSLITSRTAQIAIINKASIQTSTTQKRILSSIALFPAGTRAAALPILAPPGTDDHLPSRVFSLLPAFVSDWRVGRPACSADFQSAVSPTCSRQTVGLAGRA